MTSSLSEMASARAVENFPLPLVSRIAQRSQPAGRSAAIERSEDFRGKANKVRPLTWLDMSIRGIVSRKIYPQFLPPNQAKKKICSFRRLQRIGPHLDCKAGHGNGYPGRKAKQ